MTERNGPAENVFSAARRLLGTLLATGETRLRLAVIELEEERARAFALLLMAGIAMLLIAFGIGMLMLLIIVTFWEDHRLLAIGISALVLMLLGIIMAMRVRALASQPTLLRSTLSRLAEDRDSVEHNVERYNESS
ncbi:phage holin family protein [Phytohalomonas tamaricis]|uniref:phage holin family protein n=1 Tax=Phytohalomonas tamaricis TaxID=2081032 RepID=UPI000D0B6B7C|nr:phage holin family protein [Phytohalomonas tamaricis]